MCPCAKLGRCTHDIEHALSNARSACVSPDGELLISLRQERESDLHLCHSPRHVRARRLHDISAIVTFIAFSVSLVWKSRFKHMYASTFMRHCTVWLDSETCSRARRGESTLRECSKTQRHLLCFEMMLTYSFHVLASSSEDAASLETTTPSCREDKFHIRAAMTRRSVRFKGQLWRDGSSQ